MSYIDNNFLCPDCHEEYIEHPIDSRYLVCPKCTRPWSKEERDDLVRLLNGSDEDDDEDENNALDASDEDSDEDDTDDEEESEDENEEDDPLKKFEEDFNKEVDDLVEENINKSSMSDDEKEEVLKSIRLDESKKVNQQNEEEDSDNDNYTPKERTWTEEDKKRIQEENGFSNEDMDDGAWIDF
jgi:hypothetical protein